MLTVFPLVSLNFITHCPVLAFSHLLPQVYIVFSYFFFFQAEDGIRDYKVTGVQTCALPIFSFGTNDLTQTILGISRDDAQKSFLTKYVEQKIIPADPFQVLDRDGVGAMMRIAIERGRKTRPGLKIGICGEHGGDPSSIAFCHEVGLTYVSPSTYRVPVARLAAAQAAIAGAGEKDR